MFSKSFCSLFPVHLTGLINVATSAVYFRYQTPWSLILFCVSHVIGSLATIYWDLIMDWGLLNRDSKNRYLRDDLVLDNKIWYYLAMVQDVALRFFWVILISLRWSLNLTESQLIWVPTIFSVFEIWRRSIWNFFRLENEHLNNCGDFRVMRNCFDVQKIKMERARRKSIFKVE